VGNNALQTDYSPRHQEGLLGDPPDLSLLSEDRRFINDDPRAKQIETVTVDTASDDTDYTVTVDGNDITITSDGSATKTEIRDALIDAINNEPLINGTVVAEAGNSDDFTITARIGGVGFTFSESDSNLSSTTTQGDGDAGAVPFARGAEFHGFSANGRHMARLLDAANLTGRDLELTLDGYSTGTYTVVVEVNGETLIAQTVDGGDVDTVLGALQTDLDAHNLLSASVDTGATPSELHITPATDGFADFRIVSVSAAAGQEFTYTVDAEGDDIRDLFAGVAMRNPNLEADTANDPDLSQYPGGENMIVRARGPVFVDTENDLDLEANPDGEVYVRLSANGSLDKLGGFRSDYSSGCVPLPVCRFIDEGDDYDTLQVRGARI